MAVTADGEIWAVVLPASEAGGGGEEEEEEGDVELEEVELEGQLDNKTSELETLRADTEQQQSAHESSQPKPE